MRKIKTKRNLNDLAAEIRELETSGGREVNITDVKRVLRHLSDLMAKEWILRYDLTIAEALRRNGMGRAKKKSNK